jgi:hypothetical protein
MIAIGFRVRSGRAVAVLLEGGASPSVLDRRVVDLSDPDVTGTIQPYHAALRDHKLANLGEAERLAALVREASARSIASLLREHARVGRQPGAAALVVGSLVDPATIANEHMRAHALEGALFRTVLADALASHGIVADAILEKDVYGSAAAAVSLPESEVRRRVAAMKPASPGPWRADEKLAAAAAWRSATVRRGRRIRPPGSGGTQGSPL